MSYYYLNSAIVDREYIRSIGQVQANKQGVYKKDDALTCWGTSCDRCYECKTGLCHFCQKIIWDCDCSPEVNIRLNWHLMHIPLHEYIRKLRNV